jgi:hypothetical protein
MGVHMRKLLFVLSLVILSGCVSAQKYSGLEMRVAALEKSRPVKGAMLLAQEAGSAHFWWRNTLQGNTSSSIDGITGASNGDVAMMVALSGTTATAYIYVYDSDGTASDYPTSCTSECSRLQADGMGVGAWLLANWYSNKIIGVSDDGYRYWQAVNTVAFADTPAEGMCYWKDTASNENDLCCYDADAATWRCLSFD